MIVWLNGAFGSGKTQTAFELHRRIPNSYVYDPEQAGYFIWKNTPHTLSRKGDFQDIKLWRQFNFSMLSYIADAYDGVIIVPMTITNKEYYNEIVVPLSLKYDVKHFILYASEKTLLRRLSKRLENQKSWAARQIDRCIASFNSDITERKIITDDMNICQVVESIAQMAGLTLSPDNRRLLKKAIDRFILQLKHIR